MPETQWNGPVKAVDLESKYERVEQIGEGAYGKVYVAREITSGDLVAVKKIMIDPKKEEEGFPITATREITLL